MIFLNYSLKFGMCLSLVKPEQMATSTPEWKKKIKEKKKTSKCHLYLFVSNDCGDVAHTKSRIVV